MATKPLQFPLAQRLPSRFKPRGMALVLTVFVLGMLTILVVGFLSSMMTEEKASYAFENTQRAKLVAQGAVNHAIEILRYNIPEPARLSEGPNTAPGENWITNPGRLTIIKGQTADHVPLHTGEVTSGPLSGPEADLESVNLNKPLPGQTEPVIVPGASPGGPAPVMRVKWLNVLEDPSSPASANNRITSRYAFWMDDESTKINFNTALGKPALQGSSDPYYARQLQGGFVTPLFVRGDKSIIYAGSSTDRAEWALGKPQSVNLDLLFSNPDDLDYDKLLGHTFLHGFARYPEAVMDFVKVASPKDWYRDNKFNLTFYNRSPEFNAFGRSRFFTTLVPLSLEAGPTYQHPFVFDPTGSFNEASRPQQVLNFNSLLGDFGFGASTEDEDGNTVHGANFVNRAQLDMLVSYLGRHWPGYNKSFVDKYGVMECYQIALNALLMARMSTTALAEEPTTHADVTKASFSKQYSARTTSVNYSPDSAELPNSTPERMYWRIQHPDTGEEKLMLPQNPGPHITEVRLFIKVTKPSASEAPKAGWPNTTIVPAADRRFIQYRYEVEYYMHDQGTVVDLLYFPTRMDFMDIEALSGADSVRQQFGPKNPAEAMTRNDRNWNNNGNAQNIRRLQILPPVDTLLGPAGSSTKKSDGTRTGANEILNRRMLTSDWQYIGTRPSAIPYKQTTAPVNEFWDPKVFSAKKNPAGEVPQASVKIRLRPGMGVHAAGRPRQMIPLGEKETDTLKASVVFHLNEGTESVFSWQIRDPRLSHDLSQWDNLKSKSGPGADAAIGTPGAVNQSSQIDGEVFEPAEDSSEKSKFRYISRAPKAATVAVNGKTYDLDRPDEYSTASRVSSPGYWSMLHTGMQAGIPWKTLNLMKESGSPNMPPDYLLLDLIGATFPMSQDQWKIDATLPDSFSTASYMNSTAGQVNINSRIYPHNPTYFNPPARTKPTEAVFKNLWSDTRNENFVEKIQEYQTDDQVFDYIGELTEVPGYSDPSETQWQQESPLRNMAGVLTTRTNTFGVWGVAQVLKKSQRNTGHDKFELGDRVTGEKRFYALIERYIWPGRDGVPGNAHVSTSGKWDRLANQTAKIQLSDGITDNLFQLPGSPPLRRPGSGTRLQLDATGTYPQLDGPEPVGIDNFARVSLGGVNYSSSTLEDAYNPPQAAVKYRVVYFKYLDQ